jgi:GxxExxY protein
MEELLYEDLSYSLIGAAMEVHKTLGCGFLEHVYEEALAHELSLRGIPFRRQVPLEVHYKGKSVGKYQADYIIDGRIVLEIKAAASLMSAHDAQAHHYLAVTGLRLAILLNFGTRSLQIRRVIR